MLNNNPFSLLAETVTPLAMQYFIIAMILVIAIGFGAMPGVLALGIHTMGFLAKFDSKWFWTSCQNTPFSFDFFLSIRTIMSMAVCLCI